MTLRDDFGEDFASTAFGEVSPSVLCDCGFHEHVRLLGYWAAAPEPGPEKNDA